MPPAPSEFVVPQWRRAARKPKLMPGTAEARAKKSERRSAGERASADALLLAGDRELSGNMT